MTITERSAVDMLQGQRVGFVGLGLMGKAMSRCLQRGGADLFVANRSEDAVKALAREGMHPCASPADVASQVQDGILVICVTDTSSVEDVLFGPAGLCSRLEPRALVIDMGTTAVRHTRSFAARIESGGANFMDAPVSGGQIAAEFGGLTIMAGGTPENFARAHPCFQAMGKIITHVGPVGAGQVAKAANQMIVAHAINAVAEAFTLAKAAGVDPSKLREAIGEGFAQSRVLELHGQRMVEDDFTPGGRATVQRKDVRQALDLADSLGLDLPALKVNLTLWDRMIARGDGDLDHSGIIRIYNVERAAL